MINEIMLGDCFDLLKDLEGDSVDLILTDPPYNISKHSYFKVNSSCKKFGKISHDFGDWDKDDLDLQNLFFEFGRILKNGGSVIIFFDIWKSNKVKEAALKNSFKQPRVCQWVKTNPTPINSQKNYLSNSVEYFFTFVKGKRPTFNSKYDKGIYDVPLPYGKTKTNHPNEKPLNLFKSLVEKHSNVGDLVLDPFAGSGTTAVACIETGRNYILMEREKDYYNLCEKRINQTLIKKI